MPAFYSPLWPTKSHVIPYCLFARLVRSIENVDAQRQLVMSRAVTMGIAVSMSNDAKVKLAVRQLGALANPTVTE